MIVKTNRVRLKYGLGVNGQLAAASGDKATVLHRDTYEFFDAHGIRTEKEMLLIRVDEPKWDKELFMVEPDDVEPFVDDPGSELIDLIFGTWAKEGSGKEKDTDDRE